MIATVDFAVKCFDRFNRQMFGGRLPMPTIELMNSTTAMGKCVYRETHLPDGTIATTDIKLRFSTRFDLPETELEDVVLHEMIHYFIRHHNLPDSGPHGRLFKALMTGINTAHRRQIAISRRVDPTQPSTTAATGKRKWRVIAAIRFASGKWGVKVLPRVAQKVATYYKVASKHPGVVGIELYLHDNPYFGNYPSSAALKYYGIESQVLMDNLIGATPIRDFKAIDHQ